MTNTLPSTAFAYYKSLGTRRSYKAVADHFDASMYAVAALARRERWQCRVADCERAERKQQARRTAGVLAEHRLRPLVARLEARSKKIELVSRYHPTSRLDAAELALIAMHMERCIVCGVPDVADKLLDLLIMRMHRIGQIDRATALSALGSKGRAA